MNSKIRKDILDQISSEIDAKLNPKNDEYKTIILKKANDIFEMVREDIEYKKHHKNLEIAKYYAHPYFSYKLKIFLFSEKFITIGDSEKGVTNRIIKKDVKKISMTEGSLHIYWNQTDIRFHEIINFDDIKKMRDLEAFLTDRRF